ncbi:hypothetical protein ACYOEI_03720 [Singulisphaera rosea]
MSLRLSEHRPWFAAAYLLAVLLAPLAHSHGADEAGSATRCLASCDDSTLHFSGHPSQGMVHFGDDCLACQFRSQHLAAGPDEPVVSDRIPIAVLPIFSEVDDRRISTFRSSSRAPPRV